MSESTSKLSEALEQAFLLGSWRVDPELNQLTEIVNLNHQRTLEPRLMHLLCFLAANPGRVLTREQLTNELWPRVIVNENSLTRAVSELRKQLALPDCAGTGYLQTIPKRGYRLVCPTQSVATTKEENCPDSNLALPFATVSEAPQNWHRPLRLAACLVLAALTISFDFTANTPGLSELARNSVIYDQVIDEKSAITGGQLSLSAIDSQRTLEAINRLDESSVLSPDGSVMAFIRYEGTLSSIYLSRSGLTTSPVAIFSSEDYLYNLSWSPLGNALLFARQSSSLIPTLLVESTQHADLVMLDLDTLSVQVLIDNSPRPQKPAAV